MRHAARIIAFLAAVALIAYGMLQPVEQDGGWLLAIWLTAPLLLAAARLSLPPQPRGISRAMQNLALVIALGFVLLSLQLLRQQFVRADAIANTIHIDEQTGQSTSNVRQVLASLRVQRGKLIDRDGMLLVNTEIVENTYAVRRYPLADQFDPTAFSNIVGFFSDRFGPSGLEATYDSYLSGERDSFNRLRDSLVGRPQVGDDLHLTLSAPLQAAAKQLLDARGLGSVVVLDPKSGAVLAMVSNPGFDPRPLAFNPAADREAENSRIDAYWQAINSDAAGQPLLNRPTQSRYAPGSTFKTVTAVSALEHPREGKPDDIRCFNDLETEAGAPPVVNAVQDLYTFTGDPSDLTRVYAFSCNVAFAQYALRLGPERLATTAAEFDIFEPRYAPETYGGFTDLPTVPSLLYKDSGFLSRPAALADTGFGQGQLQITPLQMAMVAAAIANDGWMMQPYLVEKITRPDGSVVVARGPSVIRRAVSSEVAAVMRRNMRAGVEFGFGKAAQQVPPNIALVGGKSGTAEHGAGTVPHAWFIAIAPVDQPRYAVAVMVENGRDGAGVGAWLAGDVLRVAFELEQQR